ncbi:DUF4258 domain-containing protein [Thalassobaculum sp.]
MGNVTPFRRPINWANLRTDEAEAVIRGRVKPETTGNVIFVPHAWERVSEREITREDVFEILRTGRCHDQPARNERGHWQVIVAKRLAGQRLAGAVTVVYENEDKLVIRTVEWIDPR